MYCKNCGKKLPDDARFCDRCNMSVRKKEGKRAQIENLKEERLARKKAKAIEERLKNIKKVRRRRYITTVYTVLGIIILGGVSVLISYCANSGDNAFTKEEEFATPTPVVTATPDTSGIGAGVDNGEGYIEITIQNADFAYPDTFIKGKNPDGKLLVLNDKDGDATITLSKEITSLDAISLMAKYRDEIENAKAKDSLASSSGYSITVEAGDKIYHKKSYVSNGAELYYEMIYPIESPKATYYEEAIKYMDNYFIAEEE